MVFISIRCPHLRSVIPQHARPLKTRGRNLVLLAVAGEKRPLVVVGSVNADLVLRVSRLPKPGETLGAQDLSYFPGGKVGVDSVHM
jgi:hypothetical protein